MERIKITGLLLFMAVFLFSCEKEELPVPAYDRGSISTASIELGPTYKNQIFYKLATQTIVSSNVKTDWDLAFSCYSQRIFLNGAKYMFVWNTGNSDMTAVTDTIGFTVNKKWDSPRGLSDSTAFGDVSLSLNKVYIVDRGYNDAGVHQGFKKMMIQSLTAASYTFTYDNLNGSDTRTATVNTDTDYNSICYSLGTNQIMPIEPPKTNYDLIFTQYTETFYDPLQSYLVAGTSINSTQVRVSKITDKTFESISLSDTLTHPLSQNRNSIGYDWKTFDFGSSLYVVNVNSCYIIYDTEGFYWKLHFIDFYNASGIKGYPKFEFKKL